MTTFDITGNAVISKIFSLSKVQPTMFEVKFSERELSRSPYLSNEQFKSITLCAISNKVEMLITITYIFTYFATSA